MADSNENNEAREPVGIYQSGKMAFYKSYIESNAADLDYFASLTPVECMSQMHKLILQIYQDELRVNSKLGTRIYF